MYAAFLPVTDTADRAGEIIGLVERAGLPLDEGHFFLIGEAVPSLPLPARASLLRLAAPLVEPDISLAAELVRRTQARLVLLPDNGTFRAFAAGLALALGAACLTSVNSLVARLNGYTVHRRSHAGRIDDRFEIDARPLVATVARGIDPAVGPLVLSTVDEVIDVGPAPAWLSTTSFTPSSPSTGLEQADAVLIAGRGAGSRAGVDRLARVAGRLGMAFAASRPVVMNAWAPYDRLVGVSGAMLKPRLCVLAGISGSPALMAAVKRAGSIIAINTDPSAPVFRLVDLGIIGDCLSLLETFANRLLADPPP